MASINSKLLFVFLVRIQQNGIDLNAKPYQDQGRRKAYPSKIVDLGIENLWVVASASTHQNITKGYKGNADEEKEVVFSLKNKLLCRFLTVFVVLAHVAKLIIKIVRP